MVSFGSSKSSSSSQGSTFVDPQQQPFLQNLRSGAEGLQQSLQGPISGLFDLGANLQGQGQDFLSQIPGLQQLLTNIPGAAGVQQAGAQGFGQSLGALNQQTQGQTPALQQLQRIAGGNDPALQNQIGQLGSDITRQFEQLLPSITNQAVGGGQLGGGRQGVAQGLLGQSSIDAFQRGATDLRFQDLNRQLGAAGTLGGLQGQAATSLGGLGQAGFQGAGQLQQQGALGAGQLNLGGQQALQGQFNLGMQPFAAQFGPLQALAQILGDPSILSQQSSTGSGKGFDFGVLQFGGSSTNTGGD